MAPNFVQYGFAHEPLGNLICSAWGVSYSSPSEAMPGIIAPDAHVEFVFQLGVPSVTSLNGIERNSPSAMIFALRRGTLALKTSGTNTIIAFRVAPLVASVILNNPLTECWNHPVALAELIGAEAHTLLARIAAVSLDEVAPVLEAWITSRLADWDADHKRELALQNHLLWGVVHESMGALADDLGFTTRTLRRHSERYAGLSPKQVAMSGRLLRSCVALRDHRDKSIADISHRLGFNDQAAFTNAFRNHVGMTPAAFRGESIVYCEGARN